MGQYLFYRKLRMHPLIHFVIFLDADLPVYMPVHSYVLIFLCMRECLSVCMHEKVYVCESM